MDANEKNGVAVAVRSLPKLSFVEPFREVLPVTWNRCYQADNAIAFVISGRKKSPQPPFAKGGLDALLEVAESV
jgi:hypothetical protein